MVNQQRETKGLTFHIGLPGSQVLQGRHASKGNGRYQNQSKKGD